MAKIKSQEIRPGNVLEHENKLWVVSKAQHVSPGKGSAFVQVEMKDFKTGLKTNLKYLSGDVVERVRIDEEEMVYLFSDDHTATFMNEQNYEQIGIDRELIGDAIVYLQDGMKVSVSMYDATPVAVTLPAKVVLKIVEADPVVKGQTAASSYKPAILENGVKVMVPPFIEAGIKIVVNTEDNSYVERA